jgi:ATP-binding cassette, subfamily C, bacterial
MNEDKGLKELWGSEKLLRLIRHIPPYRLLGLSLLSLLTSLSEGFGILLIVPLVELISDGREATASVGHASVGFISLTPSLLLTGFAALLIARALLQQWQQAEAAALQRKLIQDLRLSAMDAIVHAEWRWLSAQRIGEKSAVLLSDLARLGWGITHFLILLSAVISISVYLAVSIVLSWSATLLALGFGIMAYAAATQFRRRATMLGEAIGESNAALHQQIEETLSGIKLVKSLGGEKARIDALGEVLAAMEAQYQQIMVNAGAAKTMIDATSAVFLAVLAYGALTWLHVPAERLLPLIIVFARFAPLIAGAQQGILSWLNAAPALGRVSRLIEEAASYAEPRASNTRMEVKTAIEIDAASFTYAGSDQPAIANMSLTLPARSTTAITGPSGAGKSTLADLLSGLIKPDTGRLLIDGIEIDGPVRMDWRRSVAYIQQDTFFFDSTVAENLRLAKHLATDGEIQEVLARAAADFVYRRPKALYVRMGNGGKRFSGGERQRLALARALLATPALLILDEATSALDPETEAIVVAAVEALRGKTSIIVISHRPILGLTVDQHVVVGGPNGTGSLGS